MLTLNVSHHIFLTKEQRYEIGLNRNEVEVVGVSVPIWLHAGRTNEPGREVFCKYRIRITREAISVQTHEEGYIINLPEYLRDVEDSVGMMLLDSEDGGRESVSYKEMSTASKDGEKYTMVNVVEISDYNSMIDSIV
jgi:hypothetical protein